MNPLSHLGNLLHFANLLLAALTTGAMFGVWLIQQPARLAAGGYAAMQQECIRAMNSIMPVLGGATVLLSALSAALVFRDGIRFGLLAVATACFAAVGLITRFLNQPLNAIVMTWSPEQPPADWMQVRDAWRHWHNLRTGAGILALCLLIGTFLQNS